jgi:competence protein ComEA
MSTRPRLRSSKVIEYRKKNGDFKSLDDLKKVPDVDAKKLDAKKDRLAF